VILKQVAPPSLLGVGDGVATPMSIEALDFNNDGSKLLVKVSFLDSEYSGTLRSAVWVYDIASAQYDSTSLNGLVKLFDSLLGSPDLSSAIFGSWQGKSQILALMIDAASQTSFGFPTQNNVVLIRDGVVTNTDLVFSIAGVKANQSITAIKATTNKLNINDTIYIDTSY
jgi:hypothetical protein